MKLLNIVLLITILFASSCETEKAFLRKGVRKIQPGTTAVLCYSNEDELSIEYTRQITKKLTQKGTKVLSYNQIKRRFPGYPEKFFLDKPFYELNRESDEYSIPTNNLNVIREARKYLKTDYILFIVYNYFYEGGLRLFVPTQSVTIYTYSFLIKYPENRIVAYLSDTYDESNISIKGISTSSKIDIMSAKKVMPMAAESFTSKYLNKIKEYSI